MQVVTVGVACMYMLDCVHKHRPTVTHGNSTKPFGYRTPEDRLADVERRLSRLERDRRR